MVQYHGVDATNYFSMRNALKNVQGKICIVTDGLLGFFDDNDLKVVCENIRRLLQEFGGYWYISYAGLRVFKIMCDSLDDENLFKIINANDDVRKILQENSYTIG